MVISSDTLLRKMQAELESAKRVQNDRSTFLKHIEKIQFLCELVLEEERQPEKSLSEAELLEQLTKEKEMNRPSAHRVSGTFEHDTIDDGTSIFDF